MRNMYQSINQDTTAKIDFVDQAGQPFTVDLTQELSFSEHTYNQDLMSQASKYVWWSSVYTSAKQFLDNAKLELEGIEAELSIDIRNRLNKEGKKFTKDVVADEVHTSEKYQLARERIIFWDTRVAQLNFILKAFDQRSNALAQLGAQTRREMDLQNNFKPL